MSRECDALGRVSDPKFQNQTPAASLWFCSETATLRHSDRSGRVTTAREVHLDAFELQLLLGLYRDDTGAAACVATPAFAAGTRELSRKLTAEGSTLKQPRRWHGDAMYHVRAAVFGWSDVESGEFHDRERSSVCTGVQSVLSAFSQFTRLTRAADSLG